MELTLDQALQKGIEAHKAGKAQEADRYYTGILKANPKHPDANHNMGVLAVGVGKVLEALPFFKTALEVNPNVAQFWLSYIDVLIKLDRMAEAKAVFEQAKNTGVKGDDFDKVEIRLGESLLFDVEFVEAKLFSIFVLLELIKSPILESNIIIIIEVVDSDHSMPMVEQFSGYLRSDKACSSSN